MRTQVLENIGKPDPPTPRGPFWASDREKQVTRKMMDLYVTYRRRFDIAVPGGSYFLPKKDGQPIRLAQAHMRNHLRREYAIAVFAGPYSSKFLCFDVDTKDRQVVRDLIGGLKKLGVPGDCIYPSISGGKGVHVDIFFDGLMYTDRLRRLYDSLAAEVDMAAVEFRPTHKQSVKLPLSVHPKTGGVCWYLSPDTLEPVEDMGYVLGFRKVPAETMRSIIEALPKQAQEREERATGLDHGAGAANGNAPETLRLVMPGTRHIAMCRLAVNARYKGMTPGECEAMLTQWYHAQDLALVSSSEKEVLDDIDRIIQWVYGEHFMMRASPLTEVELDAADLCQVLVQTTSVTRRLLFALTVLGKASRRHLPMRALGALIGCTEESIRRRTSALIEQGVLIKIKHRPIRLQDGSYRDGCNDYEVLRLAESRDCRAQWPDLKATVPVDTLMTSFDDVYYKTMLFFMDTTSMTNPSILREWKRKRKERGPDSYDDSS